MKNYKEAFTLIEALISVAISAIGFAGVMALVSTSNTVMNDTIDKEKLKFQNTEILEALNADQANIMDYNGKDLSNCTQIVSPVGKDEQLLNLQKWCNKLQGEVGSKRTQDRRIIRVERRMVGVAPNQNPVFIVSLELNAKNSKKSVYMKRVFYAQ
jgi:type II secretory pathway pseudopilin PulG